MTDAFTNGWRDDPQWLDVQYNNRARVAESGAILGRWAEASALSRARSRATLDVPYGDAPGTTLDVFAPERAAARPAPVLVFIHGGWWRALDKADHSFVAPAFTDAGALVVIPNYDLCPRVTIDTIALQMTQALAWVWRHAAEYGGDPAHIVVAGHSAGGHLGAMLSCCDWSQVGPDLPAGLVRHVTTIGGVFDLAPIARVPFLKDDLRLDADAIARLSVARFPPPAAATLACFVGALESEEFLRQNQLLREAWGSGRVPVCESVPGTNHFDVVHHLADPDARVHHVVRAQLGLAATA